MPYVTEVHGSESSLSQSKHIESDTDDVVVVGRETTASSPTGGLGGFCS